MVKYSEAISSIMANLEMGKNIQWENFLPFDMDIWIFFLQKVRESSNGKIFLYQMTKKIIFAKGFFSPFQVWP